MKCLLDNLEFLTEKELHSHITRKLKTRLEAYYRQFFPRFDLLTGEPIKFKDKEFYFSTLFNDRINMIRYLKNSQSPAQLSKDLLLNRKNSKNLQFAPSTVETKTCVLPSPALIQYLGLNYNALCNEIELAPRYRYSKKIEFEDDKDFSIITDTREQAPIKFKCKNVISKLDFGDYCSKSHYKGVFIERKSLADLCGTISAGYERFKRELDRVKDLDSYLIVCVEQSIDDLLTVHKNPKMKNMKATSEFLTHRIRELCQGYSCIQFLFLKNRAEMDIIIKDILLLKTNVRTLDIQWAYDNGILCPKSNFLV